MSQRDKLRQGVVANTPDLFPNEASLLAKAFGDGFIGCLVVAVFTKERRSIILQSIAEKIAMNLSDFASSR